MPRLTSLSGRRALVTGASSGLGRALALRVAREGARVALVARRAEALAALASEIRGGGGDALVLPCDVSDRSQVEASAERVQSAWGGVDLLVNNAGYGHHRPFLRWDVEDMERMMQVNFLGGLYWTKALLPGMVSRGEGWVVFVSSVVGRIGNPDETAYVASKFAQAGLAEALSIEVEDRGVHVLTVFPGAIRTPFFDEEALARMPSAAKSQMVEPEDLVGAILRALARGRRELTWPRALAGAYVVKALLPGFFRWGVKRAALPAPDPVDEAESAATEGE